MAHSALRSFQAIETERRFSNTLPLLDLDANVVNEILTMARDSEDGKGVYDVLVLVFRLTCLFRY